MQTARTLTTHTNAAGTVTPVLMVAQSALDMIEAFVHTANKSEVNGFAYVKQHNPTTFYIGGADEVFITKQKSTPGSADVEGVSYALALDRAVMAEREGELKLQWHSHPGDAYFSPTDLANIRNFGLAGAEWFLSLVTNRRGEIHARYDVFRPMRFGAEIEVQVYRDLPDDIVARAATDVKELLTVPRIKPVRGGIRLGHQPAVVTPAN